MEIAPEILIQAVMNMKKKERESFLEDLLASISPDYLESIKESREDYKAGLIYTPLIYCLKIARRLFIRSKIRKQIRGLR